MKNNEILPVNRVIVLNTCGEEISTTWANRALKLVARKKAIVVSEEPLTIRLLVDVNER